MHANLAIGGCAPLLQLAPLRVSLLAQTLRPGRAFRLLRLLRLAVLPHLSSPRQLECKECMRSVLSMATFAQWTYRSWGIHSDSFFLMPS